MSSKYPHYSSSTLPKLQSGNSCSEGISSQSAISHPPVFQCPNPVAFKDAPSYQPFHSAQYTSMQHAVSASSSQKLARVTSIPFGNHHPPSLQSASVLPSPSSISKDRHRSRINNSSLQSHPSMNVSVIPPAANTETIVSGSHEYGKSNACFTSNTTIVNGIERSSPSNESFHYESEMISMDGIVMLESDGEFACSMNQEKMDENKEHHVTLDTASQTRFSQPHIPVNQTKSRNANYGTSSSNETAIDDLSTPPMRYSQWPIIPQASSNLGSIQSVGRDNLKVKRKRKSIVESESNGSGDVQSKCYMTSVETGSASKRACKSSDFDINKMENLQNEDSLSASISTQVGHCYFGDLKTVIARFKSNIRREYIKEFRSKSVSAVKAEHEAIIIRLVTDNPFKRQPNKAPVFIKNCLASIVASLRYGVIYDVLHQNEPVVFNKKDTASTSNDSTSRSSTPFIYAKCLSHLERITKDFEKAFEILRSFDKRDKSKEMNAIKEICKLALTAAKACLSSNIYISWASSEEAKVNSSNKNVTFQRALTNGGCLPLDERLSFPQSNSLAQPLIPDNPASNASHETQQQTPASTVSQRSSENGTVVKSSSLSCFSEVMENMPSIRIMEYFLHGEELWSEFKAIHQRMSHPLSSCSEQTKEFESRLSKEFPWSLGEVDAFRDESTLILCLVESVQRLLCGWLATL